MQIPVGLLVDRLGTKKVLVIGTVLFTAGQLGFALAPSYGTALAARALLGCGDAMTFISVLRLGTRWFPARRGPMIAQLAGLAGMAGTLVSTLVVARLLHGVGWTAAFAGSSLAGVLVLVPLLLFLKDHPGAAERSEGPGAAGRRVRPAPAVLVLGRARYPDRTVGPLHLAVPGDGVPAAVGSAVPRRGAGPDPGRRGRPAHPARGLQHAGGPGVRTDRRPAPRGAAALVLGTVGATAAVWALTLAWPGGQAPLAVLVTLCVVLGAGGRPP